MWPYRWTEPNKYGKSFVLVGLTPQNYVGTDATQAVAIRPFALTEALGDNLPGELRGKAVLPSMDFKTGIGRSILVRALAEAELTDAQRVAINGFREYPAPPTPDLVYKAAPRDGVWATAPFMHNGSVPNLYEMLIPARERTKKFYVGREFDPVKVAWTPAASPAVSCSIRRCSAIRTPATRSRTVRAAMASSVHCLPTRSGGRWSST